MKKLFIAALLVISFAGSAMAEPRPVTTKVLTHFNAFFAGATNIQWKTGSVFVKASFTQNEQQWEAFYDMEGELVGTSRNIAFTQLPAKAAACITKKYAEYAVKETIEFNNEKEGLVYYVSLVNNGVKLIMEVTASGDVSVFKKSKI
jgi:hypothetical protein